MKINIIRDSETANSFMEKVNAYLNTIEEIGWKVIDIKYAIYTDNWRYKRSNDNL